MSRRLFVLIGLVGIVLGSAAVQAADRVSIRGSGVNLAALLFTPAGTGPFSAVIGLHGCGGLYASDGTVSARHADWAERLVALGFIVLLPDSFGSRGLGSQCTTSDRVARASSERVSDAVAARAYLQARSDVTPTAVSLLGWSNGGSTVLYAIQKGEESRDGGADFAKAVAFYPGCRSPSERGWHARLPLMILIGAADDWTPSAPCEALARSAKAVGEPVSVVVYPGAYHDFDYPNMPVHTRSGLAYTADRSGTARTGTNADARADALRRVIAFLRE